MGLTAVAAQATPEKFSHTEAAGWLVAGKALPEGTKRSAKSILGKPTEFSLYKGGFTLRWTCNAYFGNAAIENWKSASTPSERASGTDSKFQWINCKVVSGMGDCTVPSMLPLSPLEFHVQNAGSKARYIYFKPVLGNKLFDLYIGGMFCPLGMTNREITGSFAAETEVDGVELESQPLKWSHAAEVATGHNMATYGTIQILSGEDLLRLL